MNLKNLKKDKLFDTWLVDYARMDKDSYVPFEDWYKNLQCAAVKTKQISKLTNEDIIKQAEEIQKRAVKKKNEHI